MAESALLAQDATSLRPYLFSIAYRLVGSASEAEDLVQEAFVRYVAAQPADVQSEKAYLSTIVTRLALDHLKSARVKREQYVGTWLPEPVLTEREELGPLATAEQRESVSLAMLVLLERLSPEERAVFVLHEVFEYPFAELAEMLGKSAAASRQLFHRAKERVAAGRTRFAAPRDAQLALAQQFFQAIAGGDARSFGSLLASDVTFWGDGGGKVAAARKPIVGHDAVVRFLEGLVRLAPAGSRFELGEVNGGPALLTWLGDDLYHVASFAMADGLLTSLYGVANPDKLEFIRRQLAAR